MPYLKVKVEDNGQSIHLPIPFTDAGRHAGAEGENV